MYFSRIGNDSSVGTWSLTRCSMWWRWTKSPEIDRKSFLASPSYHDESRSEVEEDPSDSPRRLSCSSPRSGLSRIKVDVLRSWSPPESLTVPSAIGTLNFSPLIGVSTSFTLRLLPWISGASISSNSAMSATNMSPFQIHTAYNAYPRNITGTTSGRIDAVATCL